MGIILLFVAPFVLPSILPHPDELYSSPEQREALRLFLDSLFFTCWFRKSICLTWNPPLSYEETNLIYPLSVAPTIEALFGIYIFIVIYSQFKAMKEEDENQRNAAAARDIPTINTIA